MANLGDAVDAALSAGRRRDAEALLSLEAGAGRVGGAWVVDKALHPWHEGAPLADVLRRVGDDDGAPPDDADFGAALGVRRDRVSGKRPFNFTST